MQLRLRVRAAIPHTVMRNIRTKHVEAKSHFNLITRQIKRGFFKSISLINRAVLISFLLVQLFLFFFTNLFFLQIIFKSQSQFQSQLILISEITR